MRSHFFRMSTLNVLNAHCTVHSAYMSHIPVTCTRANQRSCVCAGVLFAYIYIRILWPYLVSVPMYVSELARACQRHRSVSLARCFARLELEPVRSTQTNVDSYTTAAAATRCPCIGDVWRPPTTTKTAKVRVRRQYMAVSEVLLWPNYDVPFDECNNNNKYVESSS